MLLSLTDAMCEFPDLMDNFGEVSCSAEGAFVCRGTQDFGTMYNVTKETEGAFRCCCNDCSCDATTTTVYGES